jgi:hypothetical protein
MSCWRCGKDLPENQTECEPPCDQVPVDVANGGAVNIRFEFQPDPALIAGPEQIQRFNLAVHRWLRGVALSFQASGLNKFCKVIDPPEDER